MRHLNLTILASISLTIFTLTSCNKTSKFDDKDKELTKKENELLKKENERLKREQELSKKTDKPITNWKTLSQSNYSIEYPSTWEVNQNGQGGTSFILFSNWESTEDRFRENVNLLIQDLAGLNIDLEKYVEISEGQVEKILSNSTLFESKRIKNGSNEYHKLIYSGDQGIIYLKFEQYCWVVNEKAYVLTFTSEENKFTDFKEIGESILNTFRLKK